MKRENRRMWRQGNFENYILIILNQVNLFIKYKAYESILLGNYMRMKYGNILIIMKTTSFDLIIMKIKSLEKDQRTCKILQNKCLRVQN